MGFTMTMEYAVQIRENIAKMIPVSVDFALFLESSFKGKRKNDNPKSVAIIPDQTIKGGNSFKNIIPKIPENKSGPMNIIREKTMGDNLFRDA